MIKILIADDHPVVRHGLKQMLADTPDVVIKDEAANGLEVLHKVAGNKYDVVLLDLSMPGMNWFDLLKELKNRTKAPILVLSIHTEPRYAFGALKAGASGYLSKESTPDELISAIRKVSGGGKYVSNAIADKIPEFLEAGTSAPHETLSPREYQIMCMLASGKTVGTIAKELYLSIKTVSTHRTHILNKMNLKTNAELIFYAINKGLVNKEFNSQ